MTYKQYGYILMATSPAVICLLIAAFCDFGVITPVNPIPNYFSGGLFALVALMQVPVIIWSVRVINRIFKQYNASNHHDNRRQTNNKPPTTSEISTPDSRNSTTESKDKK